MNGKHTKKKSKVNANCMYQEEVRNNFSKMATYRCPQVSLYNKEPEQGTNNYFIEVIKALSQYSGDVTAIVEHRIHHV